MIQIGLTKIYNIYLERNGFMNFNDMFQELESTIPSSYVVSEDTNIPEYQPLYSYIGDLDQALPELWDDYAMGIKSIPTFYNIDGYATPFVQNWINPGGMLEEISQDLRMNAVEAEKLDPNKIFSSDIINLKVLASDQQKIVKLFESRLKESLLQKGKVGLTEEDIEAMQAVTSARSAIASINKGQVDIKKSITELKIKQQQNLYRMEESSSTSRGSSPFDDHSFMNNLFESVSSTSPLYNASPEMNGLPETSLTDAEAALDNSLSSLDVSDHIRYESLNPKTYVLVGDTDDDYEFATYASDGTLIPDYPNPTTKIVSIDHDANVASDDKYMNYPVKKK